MERDVCYKRIYVNRIAVTILLIPIRYARFSESNENVNPTLYTLTKLHDDIHSRYIAVIYDTIAHTAQLEW